MSLTLPSGMHITYLGHSTLNFTLPNGKTLLLDPFVEHNPLSPIKNKDIEQLDFMLITHGHEDHMADAVDIAKATGAQVACCYEIGGFLGTQGIKNVLPFNTGGTVNLDGVRVTMTQAFHSSTITDGKNTLPGGSPAGFILRFDGGFCIYAAGDTAVFGDMALLDTLYHPDLCLLPIGDHFTMGPTEAAYACKLLNAKQVIPIHYGTFPPLTGTPEAFADAVRRLGLSTQITVMEPGQTL